MVTNGNNIKLYTANVRRRPIYTVTFNTNGGTAVQGQQVEEDSFATEPTTSVTKTGYTFINWNYDFSNPITENKIVNANYQIITYAITYELNGGENNAENPTTYTVEDAITLKSPTKLGYSNTWSDNGIIAKGSAGNKTFTSTWTCDVKLRLKEDNTYEVTGLNNKSMTELVILDEYDGIKATNIGSEAFSGCTSLSSVEIGSGVTNIGELAFYNCTSLSSIEIPNSVTSIGDYAFWLCVSLSNIEIPNNITSIGKGVFRNCTSLRSIEIGSGVTSIGDSAFYNCTSLSSIVIPNSVTSIGNNAFEYCASLKNIKIPNSVTSIESGAFGWCTSLRSIEVAEDNTAYKSIDGNLYSKDGKTLIQYAIGKQDTSFTIPEVVTIIGNYAFCSCKSLSSVEIGSGVTSIGNYAFDACTSLGSITIPNSVISIGIHAFCACTSLSSIIIPNSVTSIGEYAFYKCTSLSSINYNGTTSQWNSLSKGYGWKYDVPATVVHCSNGNVAI